MVTVQEVQSQIAQQRQALAQAQQRAQAIQTASPVTREQLQRITPMQQVQRKQQERLRALEKARAVKKVSQQQKEFEKVASPITSQIERIRTSPQYHVQQTGMRGTPVYGRVAKEAGYPLEVMGYKYETPYGSFTDWGPMQKAYAREGRFYRGVTLPAQEAQLERLGTELQRVVTAAGGFAAPGMKGEAAQAYMERYGALPPGYGYAEQVTGIPQEVVSGVTVPGMVVPPPPSVIAPAPTTWEKVKRTLGFGAFQAGRRVEEVYVEPVQRLDIRAAERLKEFPGIKQVYVGAEPFGEIAGVTAPSFIQPGITYGPLKTEAERRFQAELTARAIQAPIEKPVTTAALIAAGYGVAKVVPGAIAATGPFAPYVEKGITYGLPTLYAGVKGVQMYEAPGWEERGAIVGEAITTEVLPFYLGAKLAQYDKIILRKFLKSQKTILKDVQAKVGRKKAKGKEATKSETKQIKRTKKLVDDLEEVIKTGTKEDVVKLAKNVFENINKADISQDLKIEYVNMYLRLLESYGVSFVTKPVQPIKEPGVIVPSKVPIEPEIITAVPLAYAGTGMYERYAPSELLYPLPMIQREEEGLAENIFKGISDIGRIEVEALGEGKIAPLGALGSRLGVIEKLGVVEGIRTVQELRAESKARTVIESRLRAEEKARQRARQRAGQVQWLGLTTAQISKQRLREKQRFEEPRPKPRPRPPREVPRIGIPPFIPWWLPEDKRRKKLRKERIIRDPLEGGYMVEVRRRGRFAPLFPFALPKGEALFLGRRAVKRGAAVTFKLIPTKEKLKRLGVPRITEKALAIEFRKPIKKGVTVRDPLTFIQRRRYRIATPGERREITMKGWEARRGRKEKWL